MLVSPSQQATQELPEHIGIANPFIGIWQLPTGVILMIDVRWNEFPLALRREIEEATESES
jgi:hypothetical protein